MKPFIFFVILGVLFSGNHFANAQFMESPSTRNTFKGEKTNSIIIGASPTYMTNYQEQLEGTREGLNVTFSLGILHSSPIQSTPLCFEIGGQIEYASLSFKRLFKYDDYDSKLSFVDVKVPIGLSCPFSVSDNIVIYPYAGLYGKYYFSAKEQIDDEGDLDVYSWYDDDDSDCKKLAYGYQLGIRTYFNNIFFLIGYSSDISDTFHIDWDPDSNTTVDAKFDKLLSLGIGIKF